ncbi:MAG: TFIIB-type zinc ribbon-containing protein [Paracoccaceae bacterium]
MRCPVDNETLVMADRGGVEIDYCPKCRGVWLDRGELDKIIERSGAVAPPPAAAPVYQPEPGRERPRAESPRRREDEDDDDHRFGKRTRRRESFLSDLFDF